MSDSESVGSVFTDSEDEYYEHLALEDEGHAIKPEEYIIHYYEPDEWGCPSGYLEFQSLKEVREHIRSPEFKPINRYYYHERIREWQSERLRCWRIWNDCHVGNSY